jgi:hypothetical protein
MKYFFLTLLLFIFSSTLNAQEEYFEYAKKQISKYHPPRKDLVIIVDYRKNILSKRLFILNVKTGEIVLESTVSHAWKSGVLYPTEYSNTPKSEKSSKGNYVTLGTKYGKFGYSMNIRGLDNKVNNNAQSRAIIFHSSKKMKTKWSQGCFATPENINKKIIDMTKNGTLVCVID